jgi:hypothetical protein
MPKQYDQQTKAQAVRLVQVPSTWPPSTSADGSSSQSCLCRDLMNHQAEVLHAGASLVVHVATDFSGERGMTESYEEPVRRLDCPEEDAADAPLVRYFLHQILQMANHDGRNRGGQRLLLPAVW